MSNSNSFYSKNTIIYSSPMTTKSPCGSSCCRIYSISWDSIKTRILCTNSNSSPTTNHPTNHQIPISNIRDNWSNYGFIYLPSPNRFEMLNCLLISFPHRIGNCYRSYYNPLKMIQHTTFNNQTWACKSINILSRKLNIHYDDNPKSPTLKWTSHYFQKPTNYVIHSKNCK